MLFIIQKGIKLTNAATLRDPRQRKALSEAKDKPTDNESNHKHTGQDR